MLAQALMDAEVSAQIGHRVLSCSSA